MYNYKNLYTLDFRNVQYYSEVHTIIKESLDFPDYYGRNWDAFWDCLTDMVGRPIHIEILGLDVVERKFPSSISIMMETFNEIKHYRNDKYINDIKIEIVDGDKRIEII